MDVKRIAIVGILFLLIFSFPVNTTYSYEKAENGKSINGSDHGRTLYVGGDGPNNYTHIQDAINDASEGDTIFVFNGTYYENILINKSINLIGENRNITIIDGGRKDNVINITAPHVVISNFTITNSSSYYRSAGIKICKSNCKILDCNIFRNLDYGIWIISSSNNVVANCNISYNEGERGILIEKSLSNRIVNCIFISNRQGGITLLHSHNDMILNSIFISNIGYGVWIISSTSETISDCKFIKDALYIQGDALLHFLHEIKNNTVDGLPLLYYKNTNIKIDNMQVGEIILVNCTKSKIQNIEMDNKKAGIEIAFGEKNEIYNCNMERVDEPLTIFYSYYNDIHDCTLKNCEDGFTLSFSSKNTIHECNILEGDGGIMLWQSPFNKICCCNISGTTNSMTLFGYLTFGNIIVNNNFIRNKWDPVFMNSLHNIWLRNYWSNWRIPVPKPIFGINFICYIIQVPWIQFDWVPRLFPIKW